MKNKFAIFISVFVLTILLSGCIGGDGITLPLGEDGESITIGGNEEEGFSVSVEDKEGSELSLGATSELPDAFPDYIPVPDNAEIISSYSIKEQSEEGVSVTYVLRDNAISYVSELYKDFSDNNGYEMNHEMKSEGYEQLSFTKDNETVGIVATESQDEETNTNAVTVVLSVITNKTEDTTE